MPARTPSPHCDPGSCYNPDPSLPYVNGDPVNLVDPSGHNPCRTEGTGDDGCTTQANGILAASERGGQAWPTNGGVPPATAGTRHGSGRLGPNGGLVPSGPTPPEPHWFRGTIYSDRCQALGLPWVDCVSSDPAPSTLPSVAWNDPLAPGGDYTCGWSPSKWGNCITQAPNALSHVIPDYGTVETDLVTRSPSCRFH